MNIWMGLWGLLPFVLLFWGLAFTKKPAYLVTCAVLLVALALELLVWQARPGALFAAALEGAATALVPIIWVIFSAVLAYFVSVETGAIDIIKRFLLAVTPDRRLQAVLIAFCFGGFLEAVAGFGTAVAIPTAMLIAIGFAPVSSALMALVANSVPVAFGALGTPLLVLAKVTGLPVAELTRNVAWQLLPFSCLIPVVLVWLANGGTKGISGAIGGALFIGGVFAGVQTLVAFYVGPELVAVAASLVSLGAYALVRKGSHRAQAGAGVAASALMRALLPFVILLILVFVTRMLPLPALREPPFVFVIGLGGRHEVRVDYLTTPGTLLFFSAVAGGLGQGLAPAVLGRLLRKTALTIRYSALTIIFILILAKTMTEAGLTASVAGALAALSGRLFPLASPVLGAVGTFITGSDTSSNILFGELQRQTADRLGFPPAWLAAANTSGATAGKMISPQSIAVAASTVGLEARQSEILRKSMRFCLVYVLLLGLFVWAVAQMG